MRADLLPVTLEGKFSRLNEEAAEVIVAISKLQRFGERPTDSLTGIRYDNVADLLGEMDDLEHAIAQVRQHLNSDPNPVVIMSSLPAPPGYAGPKTIYNSTDKRVYRYDGTGPSWKPVP